MPHDSPRQTLHALAVECNIPGHCIEGLVEYFVSHRPVGVFLTAVLENNLFGACVKADDKNRSRLRNYAMFLTQSDMPEAWGSPEAVKNWLNTEKGRS